MLENLEDVRARVRVEVAAASNQVECLFRDGVFERELPTSRAVSVRERGTTGEDHAEGDSERPDVGGGREVGFSFENFCMSA